MGLRDVLLFANSIGCTADELHFLYVSLRSLVIQLFKLKKVQELEPNFQTFPTYPIILRTTFSSAPSSTTSTDKIYSF